ncbi:MAG: hypothetical protein RLZZ133_1605, partial [Pseudomonadota bacterium]
DNEKKARNRGVWLFSAEVLSKEALEDALPGLDVYSFVVI